MKTILVLAVVVAAAVAETTVNYYNPVYDSFDADELVANVRLLKNYAKCFLDQGPCTAEGSDFKKVIPDALRTRCVKCTPKQRHLIRTVVRGFESKLPDLWEELTKKEDPKGEYKEAFIQFINSTD